LPEDDVLPWGLSKPVAKGQLNRSGDPAGGVLHFCASGFFGAIEIIANLRKSGWYLGLLYRVVDGLLIGFRTPLSLSFCLPAKMGMYDNVLGKLPFDQDEFNC